MSSPLGGACESAEPARNGSGQIDSISGAYGGYRVHRWVRESNPPVVITETLRAQRRVESGYCRTQVLDRAGPACPAIRRRGCVRARDAHVFNTPYHHESNQMGAPICPGDGLRRWRTARPAWLASVPMTRELLWRPIPPRTTTSGGNGTMSDCRSRAPRTASHRFITQPLPARSSSPPVSTNCFVRGHRPPSITRRLQRSCALVFIWGQTRPTNRSRRYPAPVG